MGFYDKHILPTLINWACQQSPNMRQREKVIPLATGNVLEIGVGSGLNLPIYNSDSVKHLTAIDPSIATWNKRQVNTNQLGFGFEFIEAFADELPMDNNSVDTVVITYALCTIPDLNGTFEEIRRVLKPTGQFIFCEHGKAPDLVVQKWQKTINPLWKRLSGGCNLNRDIPAIIDNNGFEAPEIQAMYIPGWKPASFNYWGTAKQK